MCVVPVQMHEPNMKVLSLTMLSGEPHKEITYNGYHLKNYRLYWLNNSCAYTMGHHVHICAGYEVSMIKAVARRTVHRQ